MELPLHISLSRSIVLVTHERQSFIKALTLAISESGVRPYVDVEYVKHVHSDRNLLGSRPRSKVFAGSPIVRKLGGFW